MLEGGTRYIVCSMEDVVIACMELQVYGDLIVDDFVERHCECVTADCK